MGLFDDLIPAGGDAAGGGPLRITVTPRRDDAFDEAVTAPDVPAAPPRPPIPLDPRARDLVIRTVLGEAADEPDEGQAAIAAVIRNRLESGRWGDSVPRVVLAPSQFEPWMTQGGRSRMFSYAPESEPYRRAAAAVDAAFGQGIDPTAGATHFYSPTAQAALGRDPPRWAQGGGQAIGRHTFFAPEGRVRIAEASAQARPALPAAPPPVPSPAGLFNDLIPGEGGEAPAAPFVDRFAGEGLNLPQNADALAKGVRGKADELLVGPPSATNQVDTAIAEYLNTLLLNAPRNVKAFLHSQLQDRPFSQVYEDIKAREEARARQNPVENVVGTVGGIGSAIGILPGIKAAATAGGLKRASAAAATAGGYAGASELLDSKDPVQAAVASGLGAALGLVAAPVADRIVGFVASRVRAGKLMDKVLNPDGSLADDAAKAAREAGIDPEDLRRVLMGRLTGHKLADKFSHREIGPATARELSADEFGIKLSPGQAADDFSRIQFEQSAARGGMGEPATKVAREFFEEQAAASQAARQGIQGEVAAGRPVIESVNEAGAVIGEGAKSAAGRAKADTAARYRDAFAREGQFHAGTFEGIGQRIKGRLTLGDNPVIIDDVTTPVASRAIDDLERISGLRIQNKADPFGAPNPENIVAVDLRGLDQARKRLIFFGRAAKAGKNDADHRAVTRIIQSFDDEIERAIEGGLYSGDEGALTALKGAREAYSRYRSTFKSQRPGDDVGRAMESIVERDATATEVANLLYGKAAIGERGTSVRLALRLKEVFGETSEEWAAVRQGLWMRLTSRPEGVDDFGPQQLSQRIMKFVNGDGSALARSVFLPEELAKMRRFANVIKSTVPPTGAVNTSGSANVWAMLMREGAIGSLLGGGAYGMGADPTTAAAIGSIRLGAKLSKNWRAARAVRKHFAKGAQDAVRDHGAGRAAGVAAGVAGEDAYDTSRGWTP